MDASPPVFKAWAPEWLIRSTLFLALVPSSILLALYGSTSAEAAGYYGIEPSDVQFSILIFYAGLVAYFPLDPRFSGYLLARQYFIWSLFLMVLSVWLCTRTHQAPVLYALRFGQGMLCASIGSPCLTLIFSRLHSARARAIGYSVFYGALLGAGPLSTIIATFTLDQFDFPVVFHVFILLQLPGGLLLVAMLNNVRLKRQLPLSQLEWPSFVLLGVALVAIAYLLAHGQEYYWLQSGTLLGVAALAVGALVLFALRQRKLKRPYINLAIFRYRNFRIGLVLFVLYYLCRGTTGIATAYFVGTLHFDARNLLGLQLATLAGLGLSMALVVRFLLLGTAMRRIWLVGFGLLLVYHGWMYCLFGPAQGPAVFLLPMFIQGLGTGTLMVPLIVFTLSSLPAALGSSGSYAAVAVRFLTFSGSVALTGFFQLYWRSTHFDRFRQEIVPENTLLVARLQATQHSLQAKGLALEPAQHAAMRLLANAVAAQSQLRYAMGYYAMISVGIAGLLLLLILLPAVHQRLASFRQRPL